jgi:hypothetical protein
MLANFSKSAVPMVSRAGLGGIQKPWEDKLLHLDAMQVARMVFRLWPRLIQSFMKPVTQSLVRLLLGVILLPLVWMALFALSLIAFCLELPLVRRAWLSAPE